MPGDCGIKVRHPNAQVLDLPRSERAGSIRGGWFDWCAHCSLLAKVLKKPVGFFDCYGSEALQKCASARFDERLAERTRIARELADTLVRVPFCIKSLSAPR
jgi:hypothetical protein